MKHLLLTTIAAVLLVGCATMQSPETPTAKAPDITIHEAAYTGNIEAVKQNLAAGTDVNAKASRGWTPLHSVATKKIAELLIDKGADVNSKNNDGITPLQTAALNSRKEVAELLIAKGADVNSKDNDGITPLHLAAAYRPREIVELLIASGANMNAKIEVGKWKGQTSLSLAIQNNQTETADLLRKHGGKTGEELKAEGK